MLSNDRGELDPATVAITGAGADGALIAPGEGTWTVDPTTGDVTFAPETGYEGNPTPITYTVWDVNGNAADATVTVTYLPAAADDEDLNNPQGTPVAVDVLVNDSGVLDPATVAISGAATDGSLVVPGEGSWTVDPETGGDHLHPGADVLRQSDADRVHGAGHRR